MFYPGYEFKEAEVEIEIPNPYGLPPDPIIKDNDEDAYEFSYFNKVIKQMYKTHKNEFLFPAPINTSKSMEISNLHPLAPHHKSHFKRTVIRHKSDPTNQNEKKKNNNHKNSKKTKNGSPNNSSKSGSETN